jgi:nucleotide-binding universal stress UspA family protein
MFDKILVALDESEHAKRALALAADLATLSKGELRVLHVREGAALGMGGPIEVESSEEAESVAHEAVKALTEQGINASAALRGTHSGRVATEIVAEADEFGASVIVMATRGVTALEGLVIGSVTHKVLHLSHVPVLVTR